MSNTAKKLIEDRFIAPTREERTSYIGIEIEMPVTELNGGKTDITAAAQAFAAAAERFGFTQTKFDTNGVCYEAVCEDTGDVFSFDCSYYNFEISLGKVRTLHEAQARFREYVGFINSVLRQKDHLLTGMGVNPNYKVNGTSFVPSPRYKMLEGFLSKSKVWQREGGFHSYCGYPTFSSASQVQLDVSEDDLTEVIEAFSLVEPVKALLFANSYLPDEPELLCARDMLWKRSTHGINPKNLGFFEPLPESAEELAEYLSQASVFCAERGDKYLFFYPIPFDEYITRDSIEGEYFDGSDYVRYSFAPAESDISLLRAYKHIDLTARGTLEFRSACTQPLSQVMTVAAFNLGLMSKTGELTALLKNNKTLYGSGCSPAQLRAAFNHRELPQGTDRAALSELVLSVLLLAQKGLDERGFAEDVYLSPLFERAAALTSPARQMLDALENGADMRTIIEKYAEL